MCSVLLCEHKTFTPGLVKLRNCGVSLTINYISSLHAFSYEFNQTVFSHTVTLRLHQAMPFWWVLRLEPIRNSYHTLFYSVKNSIAFSLCFAETVTEDKLTLKIFLGRRHVEKWQISKDFLGSQVFLQHTHTKRNRFLTCWAHDNLMGLLTSLREKYYV